MWWPEDRLWFVATEIDFDSTLVACTRACANALLRSELEAMEVSAETRLDIDGDTVNIKRCGSFHPPRTRQPPLGEAAGHSESQ